MIPWIQVYSNILTHDKTYSLAGALKIPNYSAVGLMVSLWCWVAINAPDGDITKYPPRAITEATGWTKKPDAFYQALVDAKLIEKTEDGKAVIRNWDQYAALLTDLMDDQKKKTAERVRKHRERKKKREQPADVPVTPGEEEQGEKRDGNVTVTPSNALHNITLPNPTLPNLSSSYEEDIKYSVDDDGSAGARAEEITGEFMAERDLSMDAYFGTTQATKDEAQTIADHIFSSFSLRKPTEQDVMLVFKHTARHDFSNGEWSTTFPEERIKLLMYAFEQAGTAGCPGTWRYIEACLGRMAARGITTLAQAEQYDEDRLSGGSL